MNGPEAVALCRLVKAACPQQAIDSHTPDMWELLLKEIDFNDAKSALIAVARRQPFVSPSEIITEVKQRRQDALRAVEAIVPPWQLADDFRAEVAWKLDYKAALDRGMSEPEAKTLANDRAGISDTEPLAIEEGKVNEALEKFKREFAKPPKPLPSRMPREVRRIPSRWAADRGLQVVDPHNWDGDFRAQITEAEFDERLGGVMTKPFEPVTEPVEMPVATSEVENT